MGEKSSGILVFVMMEDLCPLNIKVEGIVEGVAAHDSGEGLDGLSVSSHTNHPG